MVEWTALEQGKIEPATAIRAIEAGLPGNVAALLPFTRHPVPAVRQAATGVLDRRRHEAAPLRSHCSGRSLVTRRNWRATTPCGAARGPATGAVPLLHRDRRRERGRAARELLARSRLDSARRSLQVALSRARSARARCARHRERIEVTDRVYHLRLRPGDSVDAEIRDHRPGALAEPGSVAAGPLELAASLWGGEPLPEERYSDWALGWRECLTISTPRCSPHWPTSTSTAGTWSSRGGGLASCRARPGHEGAHRRLMVTYARPAGAASATPVPCLPPRARRATRRGARSRDRVPAATFPRGSPSERHDRVTGPGLAWVGCSRPHPPLSASTGPHTDAKYGPVEY